MSDTANDVRTNSSAGIHWDLSSLFADAAAAQAGLAEALDDARAFRERYRGRVAELDADGLATALRELTIDETLAFVRDEHRPTRIAAYEAVFSALEPHTPILAHVYDTLVGDRLVLDKVRGYGGPRESRDLANELPVAAVDAMLAAI